MSEIDIVFVVIGILAVSAGIWLIVTPRTSKVGTFLGPMFFFRLFGLLLVLIGLLTVAAGLGLRQIGPFPVTVR